MKKLYRSVNERKLSGLLGGIGEMLDTDPSAVRLIFVFLLVASGFFPLLITYLLAWWIVPEKPASPENKA